MQHDKLITASVERSPTINRRCTVVIADAGDHAELVLLEATHPATPGTRFDHHGQPWIIVGTRHDSRVLVAAPTEPVGQ